MTESSLFIQVPLVGIVISKPKMPGSLISLLIFNCFLHQMSQVQICKRAACAFLALSFYRGCILLLFHSAHFLQTVSHNVSLHGSIILFIQPPLKETLVPHFSLTFRVLFLRLSAHSCTCYFLRIPEWFKCSSFLLYSTLWVCIIFVYCITQKAVIFYSLSQRYTAWWETPVSLSFQNYFAMHAM